MPMKKIYVFGNSLVEEDSLPVRLLPKLRESFSDMEFVHLDPTEDIPEEAKLTIIDTVINTNRIRVLTEEDIDKLQNPAAVSLHDFDLATSLKLAKKLGRVKEVKIIGVPPGMGEDKCIEELGRIIS